MQSADAIELIKERLPIAELIGRYVPLEPSGTNLVAPCPFHDETKPSFSVTPDKNCFYCFGCGKGGDIFTFWQDYHGVSFREALEQLAEMAGVPLDDDKRSQAEAKKDMERRSRRRQAFGMYGFAQEYFQKNLASDAGAECRAYLQARGVPEDLQKRFGLGWALDGWENLSNALKQAGYDMKLAAEAGLVGLSKRSGRPFDPFRARLMFPIRDSAGTTIAFGGRVIGKAADGQAKYVNTADSIIYKKGDHLFGLDLAAQEMRRTKRAIVTEGYMDVLTLHQFGYANAVAGLGTALTDRQARRVLGYAPEIVLVYDGDAAGRKAAMAASERFLSDGAKTRVVLLPEGEDIDSLLRRPEGPETFQNLQARAKPALQFCTETVFGWAPKDGIRWCRDFVRALRVPTLVNPAISYLARHLGFDEKEFRQDIEREVRQDEQDAGKQGSASPAARIPELPGIELDIVRTAVRYPECIGELAEMGAGFFLSTPFASGLWNKLSSAAPGEAGYDLEGAERAFWDRWRGPNAAPRTNPGPELDALGRRIGDMCARMNAEAMKAVNVRQAEIKSGVCTDAMVLPADVAEAILKTTPAPAAEEWF